MTKTKTQTKCLKNQHMLYFWNPDDLLIPNMMIDTSLRSSCSRQSPWLLCSGHKISSTGYHRFGIFWHCFEKIPCDIRLFEILFCLESQFAVEWDCRRRHSIECSQMFRKKKMYFHIFKKEICTSAVIGSLHCLQLGHQPVHLPPLQFQLTESTEDHQV